MIKKFHYKLVASSVIIKFTITEF